MKKIIVTTTIGQPTEAIHILENLPDWHVIMVADKKTPTDYKLKNGTVFTPAEQDKYDPVLSEAIGWNTVMRRNMGFLLAHDMGADIIAHVDDDNIPLSGWGEDLLVGKEVEVDFYNISVEAFDPIGATNHKNLWHRGFPLELLESRDYSQKSRKKVIPAIQADFWNGEADIDAICRLAQTQVCEFNPGYFPMAANKPGPFNSQNTFMLAEVLPDFFLYPERPFGRGDSKEPTGAYRMNDIWASYYAQSKGHQVVYNKASVFQERHPHNLEVDKADEEKGYRFNLELVRSLKQNPETIHKYLSPRSTWATELYRKHFEL